MTTFMSITEFCFTVIIGLFFLTQLTSQKNDEASIKNDSKEELERLNSMRKNTLTPPLTEQTRPKNLDEIIGQANGVRALTIALGGKNPQHILIYGPPGVGKTAAARVALDYVKKHPDSPFSPTSPFIEVDATIMHFDERCIADPLLGSVHDPIYQGAGAYGSPGVPQVKEGAVSRAHGGVLFIDEIGELPESQLNRLLKVLEDRNVKYESSYYSKSNKNIPLHIHNIFKYGIPADFRLVGATTKPPSAIPEALRSRCVEIFFNPLSVPDIEKILSNAVLKLDISISPQLLKYIAGFTKNGRDSVKILGFLSSKLAFEGRKTAEKEDVDWVLKSGRFVKRLPVLEDIS